MDYGVGLSCPTFSSITCFRIERAMVSASSRVSSCIKKSAGHYSRFSFIQVTGSSMFSVSAINIAVTHTLIHVFDRA